MVASGQDADVFQRAYHAVHGCQADGRVALGCFIIDFLAAAPGTGQDDFQKYLPLPGYTSATFLKFMDDLFFLPRSMISSFYLLSCIGTMDG